MLVLTHSGTFHADEVVGFVILTLAHPGQDLILERTRDPARFDQAAIVFDVGGRYAPEAGCYDHHMPDAPCRTDGTLYSSAGLLWRDYGRAAVRSVVPDASDEAVDAVWLRLDQGFILAVDRVDNGISYPNPDSLTIAIGHLNACWDEQADEHALFRQAADLARTVLTAKIRKTHAGIKALHLVRDAWERGADKRVVELPQNMPWQDAVFHYDLPVLYAVYPRRNGDWGLDCAPPAPNSFEQRAPLPRAWAGLTDADLRRVTGVSDAVFCHRARFMAVAHSREGILKLTALALEHAAAKAAEGSGSNQG